jgi:hypothetical protein
MENIHQNAVKLNIQETHKVLTKYDDEDNGKCK